MNTDRLDLCAEFVLVSLVTDTVLVTSIKVKRFTRIFCIITASVSDPDPYAFGTHGSTVGSVIYLWGSGSGSFYHEAKQ